jgi:hypothetical protein
MDRCGDVGHFTQRLLVDAFLRMIGRDFFRVAFVGRGLNSGRVTGHDGRLRHFGCSGGVLSSAVDGWLGCCFRNGVGRSGWTRSRPRFLISLNWGRRGRYFTGRFDAAVTEFHSRTSRRRRAATHRFGDDFRTGRYVCRCFHRLVTGLLFLSPPETVLPVMRLDGGVSDVPVHIRRPEIPSTLSFSSALENSTSNSFKIYETHVNR